MPDWSYRTVLRPLLFRLPAAAARDLSLGVMGALGRSTLGPIVIDFLGHMRAPAALSRSRLGLVFPTPVGLGCGLDPAGRAVDALARFGIGFLEVGPITLRPLAGSGSIERSTERESIVMPDPTDNPGLEVMAHRLETGSRRRAGVPIVVRLAVPPGTPAGRCVDECREMIERLAPQVSAFVIAPSAVPAGDGASAAWRTLVAAAHRPETGRPILACISAGDGRDAESRAAVAQAAGVDGLLVDGALAPGRREIGRPARAAALDTVARLRRTCGPDVPIVGAGGVHEPVDALGLLEAGADLVAVDSGLVFSGPGLPKRINEAVLYAQEGPGRGDGDAAAPPTERSWFWSLLMGAGMLLGSVMALVIAATRVVLPYDEQFAGMTRAELAAVNDRLLAFMAHDRVTLAGTMITIGVLYTALALFGIRRGRHWARVAVLASALAGFASFFLFLGFGYFDPFHAFVTAILFQFFLLGVHCPMGEPRGLAAPVLRDDRRWRLGQWGQLGLIAQATGFVVAGSVISFVGVTQVFVAEDLEFMRTTRDALAAASPRLIPLVAHDRATFGGMLLVSGVTFLMTSLWGVRRGERWLWWTLLVAGLAGYGAALGVHYTVGYESPWHLAPAWAGLGVFLASMALSWPQLCAADPGLEEEWRRIRGRRRPSP